MSLARYYAALAVATAVAPPVIPPAYRGLLQLCETKLSQLATDAAGRLVSISDVSSKNNPLLAVGGGNGPAVVRDAQGGVTLSFPSDGQPLTCTFDAGEVLVSSTIALLYRVPNYPPSGVSPWYFSPDRQREPRPFLYFEGWNTLAYDGGGYTNYGYAIAKWQLLIVSRNRATADDRYYHTDNGLVATVSNVYLEHTGSLIGQDVLGNLDLKTVLVANYPYSESEMMALVSDLSTRHNLTL